jgi:hypothetical protein
MAQPATLRKEEARGPFFVLLSEREKEGAPNEGYSEGLGKAMNTTTVKVLTCFALFVVVIALTLVALMLVVPAFTDGLPYSGYY